MDHASNGGSHLSNVNSPSLITSPSPWTDCFHGDISQARIEYKLKDLHASNHQPSLRGFLCCLLQGHVPLS